MITEDTGTPSGSKSKAGTNYNPFFVISGSACRQELTDAG